MRDREMRILAITFEPLHLALPPISPEALDFKFHELLTPLFVKGLV